MVRPEHYVTDEGFSQSDLLLFEKNIFEFHLSAILGDQLPDKKSDALDLGSIIDNIMLDPDNLKNYYIMADMKATGKVKEVVDIVFILVRARIAKDVEEKKVDKEALNPLKWGELGIFQTEIIKAMDQINFQPKWKIDTKIAAILEGGKEYFNDLKNSDGKYMVPLETWNQAHQIVDQLKDDKSTLPTLQLIRGEISEKAKKRYIVHKSRDLYGIDPTTGMKMKGLLDFYIEDTVGKVITPYDLKTAKSHIQFLINYRKSKYGRQGSYYTELLRFEYPDYTIEPFRFLVIPTESGEVPEIYRMKEEAIVEEREGSSSADGSYRIKGWKELLAEIAWHKEHGLWQHRRSYYETGYNIIDSKNEIDPALLLSVKQDDLF